MIRRLNSISSNKYLNMNLLRLINIIDTYFKTYLYSNKFAIIGNNIFKK